VTESNLDAAVATPPPDPYLSVVFFLECFVGIAKAEVSRLLRCCADIPGAPVAIRKKIVGVPSDCTVEVLDCADREALFANAGFKRFNLEIMFPQTWAYYAEFMRQWPKSDAKKLADTISVVLTCFLDCGFTDVSLDALLDDIIRELGFTGVDA